MAPSTASEAVETPQRSYSKPPTILASVLHGPRDLHLKERTIERPGPGELQIAIKATGICGSDVSYYTKFRNGDLCACSPLSLGHESSGVVSSIGADVKNFQIGDRVALEVGVACGECGICRKGRYNLCKKMRFRSSAKSVPHFQGTLQEKINHPAVWCHRLPDHISFDAAALLEPLSVAMHALNRAALAPASTALVTGAGAVGLLTAAMARQSGCISVTIMDVDAGRVNYATSKGFATHGFVVPPSYSHPSVSGTPTPARSGIMTPVSSCSCVSDRLEIAKSLANDVLSVTGSCVLDEGEDSGVDVTFECTGKEACMQMSLFTTRPGGKVIMVGMGTPNQTLPLSAAHLREVDILGIFRYCNTYPAGIKLLSGGLLPSLDDMVTHRFKGLGAAREAFELAGKTVDDEGNLVLKVVVEA